MTKTTPATLEQQLIGRGFTQKGWGALDKGRVRLVPWSEPASPSWIISVFVGQPGRSSVSWDAEFSAETPAQVVLEFAIWLDLHVN